MYIVKKSIYNREKITTLHTEPSQVLALNLAPQKDGKFGTERVDDSKDVGEGHVGDDDKQGAVDVLDACVQLLNKTLKVMFRVHVHVE